MKYVIESKGKSFTFENVVIQFLMKNMTAGHVSTHGDKTFIFFTEPITAIFKKLEDASSVYVHIGETFLPENIEVIYCSK
jgi:hypothetical protein